MYKIGVTLRNNDIFDVTDPDYGIVPQLHRFLPDFVILDIREPKDMKIVEFVSKLGISAYPMFEIGHLNFALFKEMVTQAMVVLNTNRIYLKVRQNLSVAMRTHIDNAISFLGTESPVFFGAQVPAQRPLEIFIQAPAFHFLKNDVAHYALMRARSFGISATPLLMFVNTVESLKLLETPSLQTFLEHEQSAQLTVQIFEDKVDGFSHDISALFQWDRDIIFIGIHSLRWFRQNMLVRDDHTQALSETAIAFARPKRDRISAWQDPSCTGITTRKFHVGQPDVVIIQFLSGNKARTADGDYIHLQYFDVEKL